MNESISLLELDHSFANLLSDKGTVGLRWPRPQAGGGGGGGGHTLS